MSIWPRRPKFAYTVPREELAKFILENPNVQEYLNRYDMESSTYQEKAVGLARFFKWLKV